MLNRVQYDQILLECLSLVLDAGDTPERAAARFPACGNQLLEDLSTALALKRNQESFEPRPGFVSSTLKTFVDQIAREQLQGKKSMPRLPFQSAVFPRLALVFLVTLLIILGGNGVILAAQVSSPGDGLYTLRTLNEDFQLFLVNDPVAEARLHQRYAQGHLVDCAELVMGNHYEEALVALRFYEHHIAKASRIIGSLPYRSDLAFNDLFFDFNQGYLQDLRVLQVLLPDLF